MKKMNKKGFTLVEIMIVVAIIGLLAAIGIPSFSKARANSIEKAKQNNVRILSAAVEEWAMESGKVDTDTVLVADVTPYLKGGIGSLSVGDTTISAIPGSTVGYYSTNAAVIVSDMY